MLETKEFKLREYNITYHPEFYFNPEEIADNYQLSMMATPLLITANFLATFTGAALYHSKFFTNINEMPALGFAHLYDNVGGIAAGLLVDALVLTDPIMAEGVIKTATVLYDSTIFSMEVWPQVLGNLFIEKTTSWYDDAKLRMEAWTDTLCDSLPEEFCDILDDISGSFPEYAGNTELADYHNVLPIG